MLCVCMGEGPKDFRDGGPMQPASSDLRHILPPNRYRDEDIDTVLDPAFIERSSDESIGDRSVEVYTEGIVDMNVDRSFGPKNEGSDDEGYLSPILPPERKTGPEPLFTPIPSRRWG